MKISQILELKGERLITIQPQQTIADAARILASSDVGALVIANDNGEISGILSERDLARGVHSHGAQLSEQRVCDLMTPFVITCTPDQTVSEAMDIMHFNNIRHVPVVEKNEVVGMVSIRDIVRNRLKEMKHLDDSLHKLLISLD